jgi:hypothetical protein
MLGIIAGVVSFILLAGTAIAGEHSPRLLGMGGRY